MEEAHTENSNPPICKSHLKSQTYFTLVRILSQCAEHPQLCQSTRIDLQEPRSDDSCNELGDASEEEVHKRNELVTPPGIDHDNFLAEGHISTHESVKAIGFQDEGFSDTHTVIDEIENIMNTEEDDDDNPYKHNNLTVDDYSNGTSLQGEGFGDLQQLLLYELEHVMKGSEEAARDNNSEGNEEVARDNNSNLTTGGNQCGVDAVAFSDSQGYSDLQSNVTLECSNAGEKQIDTGGSSQNTCEAIDSSLLGSVTCEALKLSDKSKDDISLLGYNETGANAATQEKDMDFGKQVHAIGADSFSNHMTEGGEMEEGEIFGEFEVSDKSVMSCGADALPREQRKQLPEDVDRNKFPYSDKEEENRKDFAKETMGEKVEANDVKNEMLCKRKIVVYEDSFLAEETHRRKRQKKDCETKEPRKANGDKVKKKSNVDGQIVCSNTSVSSIQNSDQTTRDKRITSKDEDAGECNKKKRGPPSERKKAKKKEKKRKQRAQKNRELGVKRLKLLPVQKPKPIVYCRHYINGRCHEGEKCKFSHDTVPLTKSKPCCHFARNSCLKGDDCPFDHQLSKYPCSNYASTGSCIRGEGCLFSHKILPKEDLPSTSNDCPPDLKATSLPGTLSSKKQLDSSGTSRPSSKASPGTPGFIPCKNTVQNVSESVLSPPVPAPKGISVLSTGKSPIGGVSSHSTPSSSSMARNERFEDGNKTDQSTSEKTQSSNDIPKGTQPSKAPKGINFLSFGSGNKLSSLNNFSLHKQPNKIISNALQVGNETIQGVPGTADRLNTMLQKNELAAAQTKSNILSHGESSTDGTRCKTQSSLLSSSVKSVDRNVQASVIPSNVHQSPRIISQASGASSLSSSQSANYLTNPWLKDTPKSAKKALMSTLAFAAKVESMSGALAVDSRATNKETVDRDTSTPTSSKNDSVKALKILDFLSSISGKKRL